MMADMAEATGRTAAVAKYRKMADEARAYLREKFIDKTDGMVLKPFRANQTPALFVETTSYVSSRDSVDVEERVVVFPRASTVTERPSPAASS